MRESIASLLYRLALWTGSQRLIRRAAIHWDAVVLSELIARTGGIARG